jgi:hypothetical protein
MKILSYCNIKLILFACTCSFIFLSCNKSPAAVTGADEFIHYTVNGSPYNFDAPADKVYAPDSVETTSFLIDVELLAARIPDVPTDFARLSFSRANIALGSMQPLSVFNTPQIVGYAYNVASFSTSTLPVMVNITEFGAVGQYIAGDFSCVLASPAPASTVYTITCNFRVKRKI